MPHEWASALSNVHLYSPRARDSNALFENESGSRTVLANSSAQVAFGAAVKGPAIRPAIGQTHLYEQDSHVQQSVHVQEPNRKANGWNVQKNTAQSFIPVIH